MSHHEEEFEGQKSTPEVDGLEVPPSMKAWLSAMWSDLTFFNEATKRYELHHAHAFAVCLAITKNDPRAATRRFEALLGVMDDWAAYSDAKRQSGAVMQPVP